MFGRVNRLSVRTNNQQTFKVVALCAFFFATFNLGVVETQAQSADVQALLDRINRLEADLNNVQRKVYQGQDVPAPNLSNRGGIVITEGGEAAALLSTRLDSLEIEQRQVTGSLEEINFKLNQMATRLDKLVLDIDFRLTQIEHRQGGGVGQTGLAVSELNQSPTASDGTLSETPIVNSAIAVPESSSQALNHNTTDLPKGTQLLGTIRLPAGTSPAGSETSGSAPVSSQNNVDVAIVTPEVTVVRSPAEQYNYAISLIRKDDYAAAEQAFSTFLEKNNDHALAGNAQYWLGETFYVRGDYPNAASAFLNGYQIYPDNSKAADNLLKLAMTLGRMEQKEEACATFQQLDRQFAKLAGRLKRIENREKKKFSCQ